MNASDGGSTNCANNNAETIGDENIVNPQISQSSQVETGSDGSLNFKESRSKLAFMADLLKKNLFPD
jgi:hypothetical protein